GARRFGGPDGGRGGCPGRSTQQPSVHQRAGRRGEFEDSGGGRDFELRRASDTSRRRVETVANRSAGKRNHAGVVFLRRRSTGCRQRNFSRRPGARSGVWICPRDRTAASDGATDSFVTCVIQIRQNRSNPFDSSEGGVNAPAVPIFC